ncbi:methionine aminopeptidase 1D, mitochondrial [Culicoides brevitarsis]|uniref:methionine aminopeptidase 1D, mitochondrial n=1 Tax=Culicoides brevitarsis TaxID=469753 RepID=UPI00307BD725
MISHKITKALKQNSRPFFSMFKNKYDLGECRNLITELGQVSDERPVPDYIPKPSYYFTPMTKPAKTLGPVERKNPEQINGMRESCRLAANILHSVPSILQPGITTDDIDAFVHDKIISAGAYPSTLRYLGFPKSICTSVNNCACHGIPDDRKLCDGDIINVDITVFFKGFHGDCSKTYLIGNVDDRGKFLVESTEECLNAAIDICKPNKAINAIGTVIQDLAQKKNLNVFPHFTGHGIGSYFHGPPEIIPVKNSYGGFMQPGMTFTIEPILTLGDIECELWEDGWTIVSLDGARSAQFEHTILITDEGHEILTLPN